MMAGARFALRRLARSLVAHTLIITALGACASTGSSARTASRTASSPPAMFIGTFEDDYGGRHQIDASTWRHGARTAYLVESWSPDGQFLLARNAPTNSSAPNLWTRIDYMRLSGMAPYDWAFCLSAYEATSRQQAEETRIADRANPKQGCNGFPFSRMKRAPN